MAVPIPESTRDLFERPILCALSTINPDGRPHTVPVWCDLDGTYVRINCPAATRKARNMHMGSNVTVLLLDPDRAFHWLEVMGHIVEIRDEAHGARDHINSLSQKYTGNPVYHGYGNSNVNRLMYLIEPDTVHGR
ncbi:MAG TPA: PPOX class F420-dependent oxidoreductase [Ktedonobacterales bacterium]|nr:PPOX class F420-dependent oxidoreductase [Ktedonobacterales bacterium]